MFDFQTLVPDADHRDANLLENLARLGELREQLEASKRRSSTAYKRTLKLVAQECVELEDRVAATPAHTPGGRHAKAVHALRDADLDQPSGGFRGFNAVALSALFDAMQAGAV